MSEPDQSGFAGQPEMVNFGDRLYVFNVRSDHQVYMSSVDSMGASANWVVVPGSPQTDKHISAVAYERPGGSEPTSMFL